MYFCLKFDQPVCPTTINTLMAFARLASMTVSFGTLKNIFSSIKFLNKANNQPYPEDDWQLDSTLKALKRELSGAPQRTLPITPDILLKMYAFVDPTKLAGAVSSPHSTVCFVRHLLYPSHSKPLMSPENYQGIRLIFNQKLMLS